MPKINVYLPDDLADAVRASGVPVSAVCQRALEEAVRRVTAIRAAALGNLTDEGLAARLRHFTARARAVIRLAAERARADAAAGVHTGHLLQAILDEGANMALLVLSAMDIDRGDLAGDLATQTVAEQASGSADGLHVTQAAANALELAVTEATALAHSFVGCEHLLLGLAIEPDGRAGIVLRSHGVEPRATRRAIIAAIAGYQANTGQSGTRPGTAGIAGSVDPATLAGLVRQELRPLVDRIDRLEAHVGIVG
jgi:ATP-dependent Clp protease ATP-binding subunit ClpC